MTNGDFDPQVFFAEERAILEELLRRLKADSETARILAAHTLELAAQVAAARIRGEDTTVAERAIKASIRNLRAIVSLKVANAMIGYIEGALIRVAQVAGGILVTL